MNLFDSLYDGLPGYPCAWSKEDTPLYRYTLWRVWSSTPKRIFMCCGLNPSTADEANNDPTIRRIISFAQKFGCDSLLMTNIFAYRATDPADMKKVEDPVGPDNDVWLLRCASVATVKMAAWGVHGEHMGRAERVISMIPGWMCLGTTKDGHPRHPLYMAANTPLVRL